MLNVAGGNIDKIIGSETPSSDEENRNALKAMKTVRYELNTNPPDGSGSFTILPKE